jgi:hypothetical protein
MVLQSLGPGIAYSILLYNKALIRPLSSGAKWGVSVVLLGTSAVRSIEYPIGGVKKGIIVTQEHTHISLGFDDYCQDSM